MKESDDELVIRFKNGDLSAFDLIVQRYRKPLINFVFRFLYDRESAEDLTQEVFIRVYKNIKRYRSDVAGFRTWIYRIAVNLCKNEIRNRSRRSRTLANFDEIGGDAQITNIQDASLEPDRKLEEKEMQEILAKAISSLPEKYKTVIILCDIENMTYNEIARIIKRPIGTVRSRINRGRLMLKDKMANYIFT